MFVNEKIISIEKKENDSLRYDITIKDNNNFFANNILVHNCQNLPEYFELLKGISFEASEKLDGSSMTVYFKDDYMGVCSRNLDLSFSEDNSYWKTAKNLNFESRFLAFNETLWKLGISKNLAFQGELCGPGIQKNPLGLLEVDFYLFNIWNIDTRGYVTPSLRNLILDGLNSIDSKKIKQVPIIDSNVKVFDQFTTMDSLLKFADGKSLLNPSKMREGIVFKSTELYNGTVTMFKAISNEYLLENE